MSCCRGFVYSKDLIAEIATRHCGTDFKIFTISREAVTALEYKIRLGLVAQADTTRNTKLFEELLMLGSRSDACVKVIKSDINFKDSRLIDLFVLEIESEVQI